NSFSRAPALMLIDTKNGDDLLRTQIFLLGKEFLHVGTMTLPPEIFQSLGRTELVPAVSRSRRGNGLEFTHDAISHRPSVDVVGLIFLRSSSGFGRVGKGFAVPHRRNQFCRVDGIQNPANSGASSDSRGLNRPLSPKNHLQLE